MTDVTVFAQTFDAIGWLVKGLAVVGGAVLGALITGMLSQLLVKALTGQKLPRYPLLVMRVLGGILAGWLVVLFVFGGGGTGFGGMGGWGFGPGKGASEQKDAGDKDSTLKDEKASTKDKSGAAEGDETVLRVEVLTNPAIDKLVGTRALERQRYYRIEGERPIDLLTLDELKQKIRDRLPQLQRLDVITREDSPDKDVPRVAELRRWAEDQKLKVEFPPR